MADKTIRFYVAGEPTELRAVDNGDGTYSLATTSSGAAASAVVPNASAAAGGITSTARMASAAASTNGTLVKGSPGRVYHVQGINNAAYAVFLCLYDAVTNPPVPGTTPIRKKLAIPAGPNLGFTFDFPVGLSFAAGIGYAFTKLVADSDTTVLVAADITAFNVDYV